MLKYWIIAETETLFLPNLLAKLANGKRIEGIIEMRFQDPIKKKFANLSKIFRSFSIPILIAVFFSLIWAKFLNVIFSDRFYSIRKVAHFYNLPYFKVSGFDDDLFNELLETKIKANPVFVQVGRKVPSSLTNNYLLINKHCSLLPAYAGVYPVFWKMLNEEKYQGITLHRMDEHFDTGTIFLQAKINNSGSFFFIYHTLYDLTYELLCQLKKIDSLVDSQKKAERSYFSYPSRKDLKQFLKRGNKFGFAFRLHPKIER